MVTFQTQSDKAYQQIRNNLLNKKWPPGARLVERELCADFDLSRTPIREAFGRLEKEGLLERLPGWGMFVKKLNKKEVIERYEIREGLEAVAARLAAAKATPEDLARMRTAIEKMAAAAKKRGKESVRATEPADDEFHHCLVKASHNDKLAELVALCHIGASDFPILETAVNYREQKIAHRKILNCIKNGNGNRAERLIREHIYSAKCRTEKLL